MNDDATCATDLALDEWSSGELDERESARLAEHVAGCAHCQRRHASYTALRVGFLAEAPSFGSYAARFAAPVVQPRRSWLHEHWSAIRLALASLATAGLTAAAVVLLGRLDDGRDVLRTKGAAHIDFYVKHGSVVRRGERGETLVPGDSLRFLYTNPERSYFALLNLDARAASVYFPSTPSAALLRSGSQIALDFSVELDVQLGEERVFAVFCSKPFEIEPLRAALAAQRGLPWRPDCQTDVITIHKRPAAR